MYKILNCLFGWDYVYWESKSGILSCITRMRKNEDNQCYINCFYRVRKITSPNEVIFLTCKSSKYFK